ncbi:fumarylacetoacetate hydrolase family protein [Pleionea sp. CnH1-48]|uniref:fumarylacetoacetate hydrolase family protein n=1 Tax=Pleionea sp. CnH1-48 TaxID=2954494 RepID=UPI00209790E8|nr:fumarylacetoacetate hydrolase family protein [Pleionea sp. CnH1-48]MCO7227268.1 fumarylacetoacetate hydrolase family protein [Pleionea sp. CnH1-48]
MALSDSEVSGGYRHLDTQGEALALPVGKVVCVGRNYVAHAQELGNPIPKRPLLFIKPATSVSHWSEQVAIPQHLGEVHHELELAVLIDKPLCRVSQEAAVEGIGAVTLALDLTLREMQSELKAQGHPWELAKAFDGACPIAPWHPLPSSEWLKHAEFSMHKNQQLQQAGDTGLMMWSVAELVASISQYFTLMPGDVVLTGTPAGVGPIAVGDTLQAQLGDLVRLNSEVVGA